METTHEKPPILINIIVANGMGSRVLQIARKCGLPGGTVILGRGTVQNRLLNLLALSDIRKEIVFIVAERAAGDYFLKVLDEELKLHKPHHGIAFTKQVDFVCGTTCLHSDPHEFAGSEEKTMYQAVYIIVDKGTGEDAVELACRAGAKGATIQNARGSGIHETSRLFNMEIEPEKEIVTIIVKSEITEKVVASVREGLHIDEPGNGIVYVQKLLEVYGLYE